MAQLHNNFSDEEVKQLLLWYENGTMTKAEILKQLGIKDSRFYLLLKAFRNNSKGFSIAYGRDYANRQLPPNIVARIRRELEIDKRLIDNPNMPIMFYNYSSIRDEVEKHTGYPLSAPTVINYAKKWGYYIERPKHRSSIHTREVLTNHVGMLLQHDASLHQWSPYARDSRGQPIKWSLITTLDDHSRKILYAGMFERESVLTHIEALESVILNYGVGIAYYSDNHSIFRYVANRDQQIHLNRNLGTDDIAPQWKQCVEAVGMKVTYAMSPEAKGKIERPYRWLQDRIVRRAARQNARTIDEVRSILNSEIDRYNNRQVHSTTGEIPSLRFTNATNGSRSCFRPLNLDETKPPVTSTKDLFCLRTERKVNGYGQVSFCGMKLDVPQHLADGTTLTLHIIPDKQTNTTEVRFLRNNLVLGYSTIPTPVTLHF
jgi:hypothetical protein